MSEQHISRQTLVNMAKELDALLPIPEYPDDEATPIVFGHAGVVIMGDNGSPMVLGTYTNPRVMLEDRSLSPFVNGFGHLFVVSYGALIDDNEDTDSLDAVRVIVGVTAEGLATSVFRRLGTDEVFFIDENCEETLNDPFLEMFQ